MRIYSDGGSRGNPGPSAIAFLILSETDKILARHCEYVGCGTNNQAEYKALISAFEGASEFGSEGVRCFLDSELVVKHLTGEYKVRDPELRDLWVRVRELQKRFRRVSFIHVPRTNQHTTEVDSMINQVLDHLAL